MGSSTLVINSADWVVSGCSSAVFVSIVTSPLLLLLSSRETRMAVSGCSLGANISMMYIYLLSNSLVSRERVLQRFPNGRTDGRLAHDLTASVTGFIDRAQSSFIVR